MYRNLLIVLIHFCISSCQVLAFCSSPLELLCNRYRCNPREKEEQVTTQLICAYDHQTYRHLSAAPLWSSWDVLENDFSSPQGWEKFYRENPEESSALEWHSSIPLETVADYCYHHDSKGIVDTEEQKCLMIGCGTSHLPSAALEKSAKVQLTLLDSSESCMETLKERYGPNHSQIRYVCGSALDLTKLLLDTNDGSQFDIILDKGLMDAFFCGEGWENPITILLKEATNILKPSNGKYVLVSYKLAKPTQTFLEEIGEEAGLKWQFRCQGSTEKVWISVATKIGI